ncbi:MAG: hypothetical protein ACE5KG_00245 [Nitrososphaerales archaeon]
MVVRVSFEKMDNPFMTSRMFLRLFECSRAVIIPEDSRSHTVLMVDAPDEIALAKKVRSVQSIVSCEMLPDNFEEVIAKLDQSIREKKVFVTTLDTA